MTTIIEAIPTHTARELEALVQRLLAEAPRDEIVPTVTATGDAAAKERGFIPAIRAALETVVEPEPPNLRHAWGDWPHDLFAARVAHRRN